MFFLPCFLPTTVVPVRTINWPKVCRCIWCNYRTRWNRTHCSPIHFEHRHTDPFIWTIAAIRSWPIPHCATLCSARPVRLVTSLSSPATTIRPHCLRIRTSICTRCRCWPCRTLARSTLHCSNLSITYVCIWSLANSLETYVFSMNFFLYQQPDKLSNLDDKHHHHCAVLISSGNLFPGPTPDACCTLTSFHHHPTVPSSLDSNATSDNSLVQHMISTVPLMHAGNASTISSNVQSSIKSTYSLPAHPIDSAQLISFAQSASVDSVITSDANCQPHSLADTTAAAHQTVPTSVSNAVGSFEPVYDSRDRLIWGLATNVFALHALMRLGSTLTMANQISSLSFFYKWFPTSAFLLYCSNICNLLCSPSSLTILVEH